MPYIAFPQITNKIVVFKTPGTYSWTVPNGVTLIWVTIVGGGGGGGGGSSSSSGGYGGGGGGGGIIYHLPLKVSPGKTLTITVGAGGNGGAVDYNGANGGNSQITGDDLGLNPIAYGGGGGGAGTSNAYGSGGPGGTIRPFVYSGIGSKGGDGYYAPNNSYYTNGGNSLGLGGGSNGGTGAYGGGGGAGVRGYAGGKGGDGIVIIEYVG
jgi:hypothetical protein